MTRHRWTDDEIVEIAKKYAHKGDWKRSVTALDTAAYQAALNRPEVFARATAHMTPKASPYSHAYYIYACEFEDHHVYVGLSFRSTRKSEHIVRGRVRDHCAICPNYTFKIVQGEIATPSLAQIAEREWIEKYRDAGWILLNKASGGGLGTVRAVRWTKEAVMAEARKYPTRQAWIDGSQMSYRIAKREGWFNEASAHMPKRMLGVGVGREVGAETRKKQSAAKLGKKQSTSARASKSAAARAWWAARRKASNVVETLLD
jgi:hypothetical protein